MRALVLRTRSHWLKLCDALGLADSDALVEALLIEADVLADSEALVEALWRGTEGYLLTLMHLLEALIDADVLADSLALVEALIDADVLAGFRRSSVEALIEADVLADSEALVEALIAARSC